VLAIFPLGRSSRACASFAPSPQVPSRLADTITREEHARANFPPRQEFWSAAFSPDGKRLVATSSTNSLNVYDTANGDFLTSLPHPLHNYIRFAFSADGKRLATGALQNAELKLWDTSNWKEQVTIKLKLPMGELVISPDGKLVFYQGH